MRIARDLLILVAVFGAIWIGASYIKWSPKIETGNLVSIEKEEELGELLFEHQIKNGSHGDIMEVPYVDSVLATIVDRLQKTNPESEYNYEVYVLDNEQVNAFTLPAGKICFYKGILEKMEYPEELAAVLAHEMGHNEEHHIVKRLIANFGLAIIMGGDEVILGEVMKSLGLMRFARAQERSADEYAFKTLEKSNIHPKYFGTIMSKLNTLGEESELLDILNTHPNTKERMKKAYNHKVDKDFKEKSMEVDWEKFQKALD